MSLQSWFVYIIRTANNSLYTGITTDIERRFTQHCAGKGAKYLKGRSPFQLVFEQKIGQRGDALRIEHWIKRQPKQIKESIISNQTTLPCQSIQQRD